MMAAAKRRKMRERQMSVERCDCLILVGVERAGAGGKRMSGDL